LPGQPGIFVTIKSGYGSIFAAKLRKIPFNFCSLQNVLFNVDMAGSKVFQTFDPAKVCFTDQPAPAPKLCFGAGAG
jgi:hypothetical protein